MIWQEWWIWMSAALVLAIVEVLVPGYVFVGFALGAAVTGLALLAGAPIGSPALALLLFALSSLAGWLGMRRFLGERKGQLKIWKDDINED